MKNSPFSVKVYHGYGHVQRLTVFGHVFRGQPAPRQRYSSSLLANMRYFIRLFSMEASPFVRLRLRFGTQEVYQTSEYDGFFRFEFTASEHVTPGWHEVLVEVLDGSGTVLAGATGLIYVPHRTQYIFISDIDDTVMISHSATIGRRLRELFMKNPHTRDIFPGMAAYFRELSIAFASLEKPNPFFYVSSSEWNLYDYLTDIFRHNRLPEGVFLLNQLKRLKDLLKTGRTGHEGKLLRVMRIIDTFPDQRFVLFGDNSQHDPAIYKKIAGKYPERIAAVYIRNVRERNAVATEKLLKELENLGIEVCQFTGSAAARVHSRRIGLLEPAPAG